MPFDRFSSSRIAQPVGVPNQTNLFLACATTAASLLNCNAPPSVDCNLGYGANELDLALGSKRFVTRTQTRVGNDSASTLTTPSGQSDASRMTRAELISAILNITDPMSSAGTGAECFTFDDSKSLSANFTVLKSKVDAVVNNLCYKIRRDCTPPGKGGSRCWRCNPVDAFEPTREMWQMLRKNSDKFALHTTADLDIIREYHQMALDCHEKVKYAFEAPKPSDRLEFFRFHRLNLVACLAELYSKFLGTEMNRAESWLENVNRLQTALSEFAEQYPLPHASSERMNEWALSLIQGLHELIVDQSSKAKYFYPEETDDRSSSLGSLISTIKTTVWKRASELDSGFTLTLSAIDDASLPDTRELEATFEATKPRTRTTPT